jgi:stress response protein YsnF
MRRDAMPEQAPLGEVVIPLAEEAVTVSKREVETGRVRVALTTDTETFIAREVLRGRRVEVERVPVGRTLAEGEAPPQSREEGDTLVIPVFEEVAVVVKRLILRQEVRLRFFPTEQPLEEAVEVRRQHGAVERAPPAAERDTR